MIICEICGDEMVNYGAVSMGDGDLSDEYGCDSCGNTKLVGTKWSYDGVNWYDSQEEADFFYDKDEWMDYYDKEYKEEKLDELEKR